jgi:dihydrofolate reductase
MTGWFGNADAFLLGRKTYEIFGGHRPDVTDASDPIATKLNALPKYVASTTAGSVDWHNSSLLGGDVVAEVTKLKQGPGNELQVHGSSGLAQTLIEHDLVDEYRLLFFPLHLGSGKKLFRDGARAAALRLTSTKTTGTGVIIATYEPAGPARYGSYALERPQPMRNSGRASRVADRCPPPRKRRWRRRGRPGCRTQLPKPSRFARAVRRAVPKSSIFGGPMTFLPRARRIR